MRILSTPGEQSVAQIAQRHGFGVDATRTMLEALANGRGSMAQFGHAEFGGAGQWMRGGMTMVSDMFDHRMKDRVDALCVDLSDRLGREPAVFQGSEESVPAFGASSAPGAWWPGEFGSPNASGSQNGIRYAYFAVPRRLAIETSGQVSVHDTLDHRIGGVSQQQPGAGGGLSFTSQHGPVDLTSLPVVGNGVHAAASAVGATARPEAPPAASANGHDAVFASIEKLAGLHAKGILSDDEFSTKKGELLGRL